MIKQREVAILGGTGFVGMELFRLLQNHHSLGLHLFLPKV